MIGDPVKLTNNSFACLRANRLCRCIFIKIFKSRKPSAFTTFAAAPDSREAGLAFLAFVDDLVLEGVSADLTVVNFDDAVDDEVGTAEPEGVLVLQLDQELPRKSLPDFGSQSFGTFGGADGRGVILRGEDDRVKISVG